MLIERDVLIACDPCNLGEAIVIDSATNKPIARLRAEKLLEWGNVNREEYSASLREQRRLLKDFKGYVRGISSTVETELDVMRRRSSIEAAPALPAHATARALPLAANDIARRPADIDDVVADVRRLMNEEEG
jgi:hypothetical protein